MSGPSPPGPHLAGTGEHDTPSCSGATPRALARIGAWVALHPLLATAILAFAARFVVATAISIFFGGSLVPDDQTYPQLAAEAAGGRTADWSPHERNLFEVTLAYTGALALLFLAFGPILLVGQLWSAVLGTVTAVCVAALAMRIVRGRAAFVAGAAAAMYPSQVLWSSLTLKDAAVWAALASIGLVVAWASDVGPRTLWIYCLAAGGLLITLSFLRDHTAVVAAWAFLLAMIIVGGKHGVIRAGGAAVTVVIAPLLVGLGPLGWNFVAQNAGDLSERRSNNAIGAASAIAGASKPTEPGGGATPPDSDDSVTEGRTPAGKGEGSLGATEDLGNNAKYLPRGVLAVVFEPTPWSEKRNVATTLASLESLLWYPLLGAALVGSRTIWRNRSVLAFPALTAGGILMMYSLSEGNVGTAYRHRGEVVWAVICLAAACLPSVRSSGMRGPVGEASTECSA